mgnify:CR=1 FL=1
MPCKRLILLSEILYLYLFDACRSLLASVPTKCDSSGIGMTREFLVEIVLNLLLQFRSRLTIVEVDDV